MKHFNQPPQYHLVVLYFVLFQVSVYIVSISFSISSYIQEFIEPILRMSTHSFYSQPGSQINLEVFESRGKVYLSRVHSRGFHATSVAVSTAVSERLWKFLKWGQTQTSRPFKICVSSLKGKLQRCSRIYLCLYLLWLLCMYLKRMLWNSLMLQWAWVHHFLYNFTE